MTDDWTSISDFVRDQQRRDQERNEGLRKQDFIENGSNDGRLPFGIAFVLVALTVAIFAGVIWSLIWAANLLG